MAIISGGVVMPGDGIRSPYTKAGAVVANDFAGQCVIGSEAVDTTNGKRYSCTATNGTSTSTWVVTGSQT